MNASFGLLLLAAASLSSSAADFFVATTGNDTSPGTRAKPFATVAHAQEAVRAWRKTHPAEGVTVTFKSGIYVLDKTIEFSVEDSGASAQQPVRYVAERGQEVVMSGGQRLTGWEQDKEHADLWKVKVAKGGGEWKPEQLWVNGQRAIRARAPNYWQFGTIKSVAEDGSPASGFTHRFTVKPELLATFKNLDQAALRNVQAVVFHKWDTTREPLVSVSPDEGSFTTRGSKMQSWNGLDRDSLFYFENFLAALDTPGEWFLDPQGWLYYRPRAGENMSRVEAIASKLERFVLIKGEADNPERWVKNIRFEGLKFRYGEFKIPAAGLPPGQAAMNVDATAIQADGASGIQFLDCAVEHIGATAFWFRHACRDCRVERTRIFDVGIEGVRIGETALVPEAVRTGGITIENCIVQSGGRIMPHTVAIWIGHNADNVISHCDIGDWFYTGISVGWRWGYDQSGAKRNRIEYNHIHHLGYRILSDMGGVYTLGPSEGTIVRNNHIHDVYATRYGGWGLYPDEGSTGIVFANNLVHDVRDGCVHQHYGKENLFTNNILAFSEEGQVAVTRAEPHLSFTFERNIVYFDEGHLLGYAGWKNGAKVNLDHNVYWRAGGKAFDFAGQTWEQWRAAGRDEGSLIANPLFVDPAKRDFRLKPGSPAEKIGFVAFDTSQAGVTGPAAWKGLAASVTYPKPYTVPGAEPLSFKDDFEQGGATTPLLSFATLSTEKHPELIAITDTVCASGKRCLKVQDRPDLQNAWEPHFYLDPHHVQGVAKLAFKIRLEPGASVNCEWRDNAGPYRTGPSLHLGEGAASSRGEKLLEIPSAQWIGVEMSSPLGKPGNRWALKLALPDGSVRSFTDLPCEAGWKETRWLGFSSVARNNSAFYLDDFSLENH